MARLTEVEVSLGITVESKGVYYKPNARIVLELDSTDTKENRELLWKQAWDVVTEQVAKQIESIK